MLFGTVNPLQKPRFLGESSGHWTQNPFQNQKTKDPILQAANFGQDLNCPILTCRMTSQPINLKSAQHFHVFFDRYKWNVPHSTWVRSLPHPPGARFYAPQPRATGDKTCSLTSALRQTKTKEPNDVQALNMTQLESASKTQTTQYRAPRPRLHLPKNNSHKLIRCNGDVNVTVISLKTKINGCNGSREDGTY